MSMRISKEKLDQIKAILGRDFIIVIAIPEEIKKRGTKEAGIANLDMVASIGPDAVKYTLLAAAITIIEGKADIGEASAK